MLVHVGGATGSYGKPFGPDFKNSLSELLQLDRISASPPIYTSSYIGHNDIIDIMIVQ